VVLSDAAPGTEWLIDKSALVRLGASTAAAAWAERIQRGMIRIATVTLLEVGYSARDARDLEAGLRGPPVGSMPIQYATPVAEDRAVHVLTLLAERGHHRAPSLPDLIVAATAESAGLVVLHDDKDFDLIAEITGQPVQRLSD
jgi:predicted nucleic acid-binding protein